MRLGLLTTSIGSFGKNGYYNLQEIGLAKALDTFCDELVIYKLVSLDQEYTTHKVESCSHAVIHYVPSKKIGNNGIIDFKVLDPTLDVLIHFSDTQLSVPQVFRWAKKNLIRYFPYIGVLESHSANAIKQAIVNLLFRRNLAIYRKCHCYVKTPTVQNILRALGVDNITVTPVGLDLSLVNRNYDSYPVIDLKKKYGYQESDKIILFIGRFVAEKEPIKMIELFAGVKEKDDGYKLLMVGSGVLEREVLSKIQSLGLDGEVQIINMIPNDQIWELYRLADCFVNLNQNEIFGMAILEAMYYGCKVIAWKAPGPSFIIESGLSGMLVETDEEAIRCVISDGSCALAHERIQQHFTWDRTASVIYHEMCEFREL